MANEGLSLLISSLEAPQSRDRFLEGIKFFWRLAGMSETGRTFACLSIRDIDVMSWRKLNSILSVGNLIIE